jgi:hypothetical protein
MAFRAVAAKKKGVPEGPPRFSFVYAPQQSCVVSRHKCRWPFALRVWNSVAIPRHQRE